MTADRVGPLQGHVLGHSVTVVVVCGFIGCDWSMEIGTAPIEAHNAYLDHLDVHDVDVDQEDAAEHNGHETEAEALDCPICSPQLGPEHSDGYQLPGDGLYAGDTAEQMAAEQSRVDRFMAGGNDA